MSVRVAPLRSGAGDPENSIQNKPMIFWRVAAMRAPRTVTNGSKQAHSSSDINPRIKRASFRKRP
jgi:hypothetical protein